MPQLRAFSINGCVLDGGLYGMTPDAQSDQLAPGAFGFIQGLATLKHVSHLKLSGTHMCEVTAGELVGALQQLRCLVHLNLKSNPIF